MIWLYVLVACVAYMLGILTICILVVAGKEPPEPPDDWGIV